MAFLLPNRRQQQKQQQQQQQQQQQPSLAAARRLPGGPATTIAAEGPYRRVRERESKYFLGAKDEKKIIKHLAECSATMFTGTRQRYSSFTTTCKHSSNLRLLDGMARDPTYFAVPLPPLFLVAALLRTGFML